MGVEEVMPITHGRVIAWFVTVVNPIVDRLRTADYYLGLKRWTWRYRTGFFEVIYPTTALVTLPYHPNLEDLLGEYPTVAALMSAYDEAVMRLAEACTDAHAALFGDAEFGAAVEQADREYVEGLKRPDLQSR